MLEICGYFNVEFRATNEVNNTPYMTINRHVCVNTVPNEVPYPIEHFPYVLDRVTSAFQIDAPETDINTTQ